MSLKDAKISFLVDIATDLFMSKSINEVTIKDIAVAAQVGEATIYRYFSSKQNIVVQVAMKIQAIVSKDFFNLEKANNGFEKLKAFYESYLEIFNKHPNFYKFLNDFDAYVSIEDSKTINPYETAIEAYKQDYMKAYELGLIDGTIKKQNDIEMFYFSTTHSLLELAKKLAFKKAVLNQDTRIKKTSELECLINIYLEALNNR